jgi:hypothetical protein
LEPTKKASVPFIEEVASLNFGWANVAFYIPGNYLIIDMKKELDNQVVSISYKVQMNTNPYYGQDTVVDRKDFVYGQPITWDIQGGTFSCD